MKIEDEKREVHIVTQNNKILQEENTRLRIKAAHGKGSKYDKKQGANALHYITSST